MAKIDLDIPSLVGKFVDLKDTLPGDAYKWSWERPLSQVNFLAIHHSATSDTQTPQDLANTHININGWGGIGYHFLIAKDGVVYYVGDISTARANVANLNEQVIGICIMGNFTQGKVPTTEQLDSAHKLCEFFIDSKALENVNSWDKVRGHKELPNQSTNCPGDDWTSWRIQIVEGVAPGAEVVFNRSQADLESQIESLQTSLASVNQQAIFLQETLQEREKEISSLKAAPKQPKFEPRVDNTLTIPQALVNLYKFLFPPGKES